MNYFVIVLAKTPVVLVSAMNQFRVAKAAPKVAQRKMAYLCQGSATQRNRDKEVDVGQEIVM